MRTVPKKAMHKKKEGMSGGVANSSLVVGGNTPRDEKKGE